VSPKRMLPVRTRSPRSKTAVGSSSPHPRLRYVTATARARSVFKTAWGLGRQGWFLACHGYANEASYPHRSSCAQRADACALGQGARHRQVAVLLQYETGGAWRNVELFDCSHPGQNDRHRYSREDLKGEPQNFHHGTPAEAFRAAVALIRDNYERMIDEWQR